MISIEPDGTPTASGQQILNPVNATLTNGVVVTVYEQADNTADTLGMSSVNLNGATGFGGYSASSAEFAPMTEPDIAALTGGGFVVVYTTNNNIQAAIWNSAGNTTTTVEIANTTDLENEPTVVGLQDGGFFVVWDNDTSPFTMEGQRFDANGSTVGDLIDFGVSVTDLDMSTTTDGRIVLSYRSLDSNQAELLYLDPRDSSFTLETGGTEATTRLEGGTVFGSAGIDKVYGQGAQDTIYGLNGDDQLYGAGGRDYLGGGGGNDSMYGGQGNDVYVVGSVGDLIFETPGNGEDSVRSGITYTLNIELEHLNLIGSNNINGFGNNKDNVLQGNTGHNQMAGFKGNDIIKGFNGRDGLVGNDGADRLLGMQGNDVLRGDLGADVLFGGAGNDRFVYRSESDSKINASQRDIIKDFTRGADKIDLRQLDASETLGGDQSFQFIGGAGFNGNGDFGQVRFNAHSEGVMVAVDTDGNGSGDMLILVEGASALSASDFLL